MHGGATGSGAPRGNANAVTHSAFTKKAIEGRKSLRQQIQYAEKLLKDLDR
jgi:glucans biosynthesis protein